MISHGVQESFRLSPMQEGMFFHHLSLGKPGVDCEQIVCSLTEPLDLDLFQQAWARVAARHAAFRCEIRFETDSEDPRQVIHHQVTLPWHVDDWRHLSGAALEVALADYLRTDRDRGFDLSQAPLMRFAVFQTGDDQYQIVWTFHHILFDGRSFAPLLQEAFATYQTLRDGGVPDLPQTRPFREHIDWLECQDFEQHESFWRERLAGFSAPTALPSPVTTPDSKARDERGHHVVTLARETSEALRELAADLDVTMNTLIQGAWALLLGRHSGEQDVVFGAIRACRHSSVSNAQDITGVFINTVPIRVSLTPETVVADWLRSLRARDLELRAVEQTPLVTVQGWSEVPAGTPLFDSVIVFDSLLLDSRMKALGEEWQCRDFQLHEQTSFPLTLYANNEPELHLQLAFDGQRYDEATASQLMAHLETLLGALATHQDATLAALPMLTEGERQQLLFDWNNTAVDYPESARVHELFEQQAARTPDATAVVFRGQHLTYAQLNERANQLAHHLRAMGVGSDVLVAISTDRSVDMMVGLLGILKAGGAYLPLDPSYPASRIEFMLRDSKASVLVTQEQLLGQLPTESMQCVCLDADWEEIAAQPSTNPDSGGAANDLAYVIYTSGSTGKPKGVMVEHGNVVNFFAGMDERIPHDSGGVWLAVTSLSFDISVLELFWTLARGFKVVLHPDDEMELSKPVLPHHEKQMDFSLFYFSSTEGQERDKYRLVMEGARFADEQGFSAVWTPERHFHDFGGLYPNPSVMGAALASVTKNVGIRAGSVVLPLHHPARVVEEWSVVDNLSNGRVGLSFASGWNPNDFVLRPEAYADAKTNMFESIEIVKQLWRGEEVAFLGVDDKQVKVRTLPRPLQSELPIWVTTAGNPETYRMAGAIGANILTHLLGQTVEEVEERIAIYRQALESHGFGADHGCVSMMLHTFVGDDTDEVREIVRQPMIRYLGSALGLVKNFAAQWTAFKKRSDGTTDVDMSTLSKEDMDDLLAYSFERYFETSGLFGTPERCLQMVDRLKGVGVDEIACLIDFGVETDTVLEHLHQLTELKATSQTVDAREDYSLAGAIRQHGVTHLQCTPSTMSMYLLDERASAAIATVQTLMIGGEAFPNSLASQLRELGAKQVINMYGPTETTIWSSTYEVHEESGPISIGRPIANTQLYILDEALRPVPRGVTGELYIGGDGVVRGYLFRDELTNERFVPDPFQPESQRRIYRTGDLARYRADGTVEFLGRVDHQVKVRGHRIELGEIEDLLRAHAAVREAVVVAREDVPGDQRLVAYVVLDGPQAGEELGLRDYLREQLPEFMVPSHCVPMEAFPLTPNAKIDRKSLPAPSRHSTAKTSPQLAPGTDAEEKVMKIWTDVLGVSRVGVDDNFFDMGGHSLLAVKAHRMLKQEFARPVAITDLFRYPTVRTLAEFLNQSVAADPTTSSQAGSATGRERAQKRLRSRSRRRTRTR